MFGRVSERTWKKRLPALPADHLVEQWRSLRALEGSVPLRAGKYRRMRTAIVDEVVRRYGDAVVSVLRFDETH